MNEAQRLRELAEALDGIEWDIPLCSKDACIEAADELERLQSQTQGENQ